MKARGLARAHAGEAGVFRHGSLAVAAEHAATVVPAFRRVGAGFGSARELGGRVIPHIWDRARRYSSVMNYRRFSYAAVALFLGANAGAQPGSKETIANLNAAHLGEANAQHRYVVFARTADAEGYAQVAKLFRAASVAEATHEFTHMGAILNLGGKVGNSALDTVAPGTTLTNLKQVVVGESYERDTMYPGYLKLAEAENAHEAVRSFGFAMAVEKQHARLFTEALGQLGKNPPAAYFVCPSCGTTTVGEPAKGKCPICQNPTAKYVNVP